MYENHRFSKMRATWCLNHRKPILYVCLIGFLWYHGVERNISKCMGWNQLWRYLSEYWNKLNFTCLICSWSLSWSLVAISSHFNRFSGWEGGRKKMKTRMESWLVSKLVKKRPRIDRSSIFAGFSNPRASTNRNSEGQELHLYFKRKSPVQPILSMNKSSCNFKQKAIWQLAPENQCSKETVTARRGWTPVTRFKFHAKGTPDRPEMCIIMQYWHPRRKVIFFLLLLVWAIKTSSSIYLKFSAICRGNISYFWCQKTFEFLARRVCPWHEIWILWLESSHSEQ